MKNYLRYAVVAASALAGIAMIHAENVITWETLGNSYTEETGSKYIQRFTIEADGAFERMAFCAFKRGMKPMNPADTLIELLPGYFAIASERFSDAGPGNPIVVDIITDGALRNISYRPDGMHLVADGRPTEVRSVIKPTIGRPVQYRYHKNGGVVDPMIYGAEAYAINDSLRSSHRAAPYMGIPTPKSVKLSRKMVKRPTMEGVKVVKVSDPRKDYYRARIQGPRMTVYTNSENPDATVASIMRRIKAAALPDGNVPAAEIEDWADYAYRGMMIDVARNFTSVEDMKSIMDLMAEYGLNVLHFHAGDDEGWRVEIPELPELTSVGSRRGYTERDDVDFLKGIYSGNGNADDNSTPANGHYSVEQFIDLLRYAKARGIDIIPEFDTPGHSRAAIRAMEHRYRSSGDSSLRLVHDGDTSVYTSAQAFHDNIMNPALEGPYRFWDTVFASLADTYAKAGVELKAVHIGGDEVPEHAWDGSEAAGTLMAEKGMKEQSELHAYFVERVSELAERRGIKIAGWQEIALKHPERYNDAVRPRVAAVNCWTNLGDKGVRIAEAGYPLILSNVDYLYFDQTPTTHPEEPGLTWGGIVDEFSPLHATKDRLCPSTEDIQKNVKGISGHLFAETVRNRGMIERYMLPRLLGLAERAHNSSTTLSDEEYFGIITAEMNDWAREGHNFYLRQPGIRLHDGKIEMNEAYGKGEIRYTIDGSTPERDSAQYEGPIDASGIAQVRARLFYGPAESVTSILYIK
ncbi:MAG: family 20 glycosylhydrolase [Muribaculaceae bacterium]|nr:family 20 glycosylhydrolase [Muribaculaceae bacterium]